MAEHRQRVVDIGAVVRKNVAPGIFWTTGCSCQVQVYSYAVISGAEPCHLSKPLANGAYNRPIKRGRLL